MNLLMRYVARAVIEATLLVLMVLLAIDLVFALLAELDKVGDGQYGIANALVFVALTVPQHLYSLFPTAVLLGSLLGLGQLANHSELIVMRAAGVAQRRMVSWVLQLGFVLALFSVVVGEWVAAPAEQSAQRMRSELIAERVALQGKTGLWIRDGGRYLNIRKVLPGLHLQALTVYEFADQQLLRAISADSAQYTVTGWQLRHVVYSELSADSVTARSVDAELWPHLLDPKLFGVLLVQPDSMSIADLYRYTDYLKANGLDYARYELSMWRKLAVPASVIVMLLLAVPFVFGSNRNRGSGQRILLGSVLGISYFLLDRLFTHVGLVYGIPASLSAFMPVLLFAALAIYSLRRLA